MGGFHGTIELAIFFRVFFLSVNFLDTIYLNYQKDAKENCITIKSLLIHKLAIMHRMSNVSLNVDMSYSFIE